MGNFELILLEFKEKLWAEYGKEPIFKVVFEPDLYNEIMISFFKKSENTSVMKPSSLNNSRVSGIKIDARGYEEF